MKNRYIRKHAHAVAAKILEELYVDESLGKIVCDYCDDEGLDDISDIDVNLIVEEFRDIIDYHVLKSKPIP